MKYLIILASILLFSCKTVEERIKDYSYTDYWHYENGYRYQVYQTKNGKQYIIVFNKNHTNLKRKYIGSKSKN